MADWWGEREGPQMDEGQGLAEYALILALIAVVDLLALSFLGDQIFEVLSEIGSSLESVL